MFFGNFSSLEFLMFVSSYAFFDHSQHLFITFVFALIMFQSAGRPSFSIYNSFSKKRACFQQLKCNVCSSIDKWKLIF